MKYIEKSVSIIERNGFILLVSKGKGIYDLPGGISKKGEGRLRTAERELREETGLETISFEAFGEYLGRIRTSNGRKW